MLLQADVAAIARGDRDGSATSEKGGA